MAAIHSCPGCGLCRVAPNLAELKQLREKHQQVVHGNLNRGADNGQRAVQ